MSSSETRRSDTEDDDELIIRGELHASSVPELLRSLLRSNETGILTFRRDEVTKRLFIHDGQVVYAVSTNPEERLGESLMLRGKLSARQYLEASKRVRPGQRLGTILVEMGALEAEDLVPAVEAQVRELLMDLLTWTHGDYEFVIRDAAPDNPVTVEIPTHGLILDGIRRARAWSRILRGIGGDIETVFTLTGETDILHSLELTNEEQEVLARVNGRSTVEQICQVSYLSNFETCRTLWALVVLGVIRKIQPGEAQVDHRAARPWSSRANPPCSRARVTRRRHVSARFLFRAPPFELHDDGQGVAAEVVVVEDWSNCMRPGDREWGPTSPLFL